MKRNLVLVALCASALVVATASAQVPKVETPVVKISSPVLKAVPAPAPTVVLAATATTTAAVTPAVPGVPQTGAEVVDVVKQGVDYAKAKNWFGLSAACIFVVMFLLNALKVFDKIGKRYAYLILPVLGVVAMLLSKFVGGASWEAALVVLTSAPCTGLLWDFFKKGILATEPTTPMKPA